MKRPPRPPATEEAMRRLLTRAPEKALKLLQDAGGGPADPYEPWDRVRFMDPPEGLDHEEWWAAMKFMRRQLRRTLPLHDTVGRPFGFALPDTVLKSLEALNRDASGQIAVSEQVTNPATRDRYLIDSLIEEAVNSSQLEGASTSRRAAKEMIREGRRPRTRDERRSASCNGRSRGRPRSSTTGRSPC